MLDFEINDLLRQFSRLHNFEYKQKPIPYRPYGEVVGKIKNNSFKLYIYQTETRISRRLHTIFNIVGPYGIPKGFCIDHQGELHSKNKSFEERVVNRSYDPKVAEKFLNEEFKAILMQLFDKINEIENSVFQSRCSFRISDRGIMLSIDKIFCNIDELNTAFEKVLTMFLFLVSKIGGMDGEVEY